MNSFFKNVRIYFREYCNHTSVHGFQYIGEKKRTIFERIWWVFIFSVCLAACLTSIYAVYKKWERSPVIVNFANRGTPIYEIPFPAVTICPEAKSAQDKFNFTKIMQKKEDGVEITSTEETQFEFMSLLCNYYPHLNYTNNFTFTEDFYEFMDEVKPRFHIQNCTYITKEIECDMMFSPIITDEGVCYTFNMLDRNEIFKNNVLHFKNFHEINIKNVSWSLQNGYTKDAGMDPYPFRASLAGATNGFSFNILTSNQDLDYACKNALQGYRVLLHTPMTMPRPSQNYFRIPLDQSVVGAVQPVMITTSETIKMYNAERRKCYFSAERYLKYFKEYTSSNCNMECLTNYTLLICKCVDFFMPRQNGTEICGTGKIRCMKTAKYAMQTVGLMSKLEHKLGAAAKLLNRNCNCLPVCSDLTYEVETSQTDWDWNKWLNARRNLPRVNNKSHLSSLTLFFKSDNFITSERNELYGPIDFLANFGGLLGLFTGFSVLSLMEIIYFLSVRLICNIRLHGQWSGIEN